MISCLNKKIILWIVNFILVFLVILIGLSIICAAIYFPLIWIGAANIAKGCTITTGVLYMAIVIIKIIAEAMN